MSLTTRQILLVDDDASGLRLLKSYAEQAGYRALTATDATAALELFGRHHPRIVISDWLMPGMDGLQLCQKIRAMSPDKFIFFMILSVNSEMAELQIALDAGVDDYLVKPLRRHQLLPRLKVAERLIDLEGRNRLRLSSSSFAA